MKPGPDIECPKCHVAAGLRCRTLATGRSTDTHLARYDALYERAELAARARVKIVLPPPSEVCTCGNRFDGDNLCMISACEQET